MKRFIAITLLCSLCIFLLYGCQASNASTTSANSQKQQITYQATWPFYDTVSSLTEKADAVFTGTVINISFAVVDIKTGKTAESAADGERLVLHTVYEIEVRTVYKGKEAETQYLAIMGGIPGYNEDAQYQVMKSCGIYQDNMGIPILQDSNPLAVGSEYLFVLCDLGGDHLRIPNLEQYAFSAETANAGDDSMLPNYDNIMEHFALLQTEKG